MKRKVSIKLAIALILLMTVGTASVALASTEHRPDTSSLDRDPPDCRYARCE